MSTVESNVAVAEPTDHAVEHDHHDPNLAHHFDTPDQQYQTGKLGMWVFLATELLMFGGLFCAYTVYRHNHPEVFEYAHQYLNKWWGGLNTLVLITSSLTMAWGVRAAQLGQILLLKVMLVLTLCGAAGFMVIKTIEYTNKYDETIMLGEKGNLFYKDAAETTNRPQVHKLEEEALHIETPPAEKIAVTKVGALPADPNAGTPDAAVIVPPNITPAGRVPDEKPHAAEKVSFEELDASDRHRVYTFFGIYFFMTGLHGVHVLVGMGLITWVLVRANRGDFGPKYFAPVDLVGLYWHLVDLIWIFLFPLLYLIH